MAPWDSTTVDVQPLIALSTALINGAGYPSQVVGARYFIAPGRRLCVCRAQATTSSPFVSYAGFVPYQ